MTGVFQSQSNRNEMRELIKNSGINLELFCPNFTDDESEDNDCSENESEVDSASDNSSQQEKSEGEDN